MSSTVQQFKSAVRDRLGDGFPVSMGEHRIVGAVHDQSRCRDPSELVGAVGMLLSAGGPGVNTAVIRVEPGS